MLVQEVSCSRENDQTGHANEHNPGTGAQSQTAYMMCCCNRTWFNFFEGEGNAEEHTPKAKSQR